MAKGEDSVYISNQNKNEILEMIMTNDIINVTLIDTYQKPTYNPYDYRSYDNCRDDILISETIFNYKFTISQRNSNELFALSQ